ncbi:MAG: DUF4105 domain-containing protein, partial [Bdellovibrionaceae bacterium]|nr:DUF4105 domain-containing protein [Pseudobdellovibrionaceae bacterium]
MYFPHSRANASEMWEDPVWIRLVQYRKSLLGKYESPAESAKFFLSPEGRTRPDLEFVATVKDLQDNTKKIKSRDGRFEDLVACVFPARKIWLEKKLGTKFPSPNCERFERFKEILAPQSLTYVFSSYYLNNPASAFGHTFLRINKAPSSKDGERYELSDYGVGYAAEKVSENPLVYSFLGVSGLMPGTFDINPYYYKVREYNDFESRDLWEYDLNFNPEEVTMVIAYIWELLDVGFNYHYFSENCSYRILSLFEVARPSLDLTAHLKSQVMPADTVQTLFEQAGLITNIHFRPSVRATFENRYRGLDSESKKSLRQFARDESVDQIILSADTGSQRSRLDAAMDYIDFRYPKEIMRKEGKYFFKKQVLAKRASLGGASDTLNVPAPFSEAPHDAQGSRRLGIGYREVNGEQFYRLDAKLALHDLLDPKLGYPPTAQITMGEFAITWNAKNREVALDRVNLYEVISLSPVDDFIQGTSWRLKFANERGVENNCVGLCRWTELSGGSGVTKTFFGDLDLTLWGRVATLTSSDFKEDTWRAGVGPGASIRWNRDRFALWAETFYRYDYKGAASEFRRHSLGINWSFGK